jgi:hypothetical protein
MPEPRSPTEGDQESGSRAETERDDKNGQDRRIAIVEAALLAVVAVLTAWSGFASARWSTESSLRLATATADRTLANRVQVEGLVTKNFDVSTFNDWFTAYVLGNKTAEAVAIKRFRPAFRRAFDAWIATDPFTNPHAPPGPTYMRQYVQPGLAQSVQLDAQANRAYSQGESYGNTADEYVRTTIYLATVLFLVGIAVHFRQRSIRIALSAVGGVLVVVAVISLISLPKPAL